MKNEKLIKWASSLVGCDGGNIENAKVWICGIEWGFGNTSDIEKDKYYKDLKLQVETGEYKDTVSDKYNFNEHNTYRYGQSFSKMYTVMKGEPIESYKTNTSKYGDDEIYKLNLYPIAFQSVDDSLWKKHELSQIFPDFEDKTMYRTWCLLNRFPYFQKLVEGHTPKVIICTGTTYLTEFFIAFSGHETNIQIKKGTISPKSKSKKNRYFYYCEIKPGTFLFIIPFFSGSNGLNSYHLLEQMGQEIKRITNFTF